MKELWRFEKSTREAPQVLESYFEAVCIANMLHARRHYDSSNTWSRTAAERLEEAFETEGEHLRMYFEELDDPYDIDDEPEALPRKRRQRTKAEIISDVVAKRYHG